MFRQDVHDTTFAIRLSALKRRIFRTPDVVLHRREIMGRQGIFAVLENDTVRADFDAQFANLVGYLPGPAFTVSIDKQAYLEKYKVWQFDPYCLVERFVLWLNRYGFVGDVMGEARGPKHDARLRMAYGRLHKSGSDFVDKGLVQAKLISRELRLEPKTMNVAGLQVADLLAHPAHRTFKFLKLGMPEPEDYGASLIKTLEAVYDRHPRSGAIEGCGRKWLP